MIQDIINSISIAINDAFGYDYYIYTESIEQGLKEPCFFITTISPSKEQFLGRRYFSKNTFCIHYMPKGNKNEECIQVAEQLFDILEILNTSIGPIRGRNLRTEIVDGMLHFFVDYNVFSYKEVEQDTMDSLEVKTTNKEDA